MITKRKFFWCYVAAGLCVGVVAGHIDFFRVHLWLDNLSSPMASYLRSLDCKRVEAWLRADCERAHARAVDPGLVTVAEEIDREQALMKLAVSGLRQHAGPVVRYQAVDTHPGVSLHRGVQEAKREVYLMLPREALNAGDADADTGERLRMTRMVPVSMKE